MLEGVDEPLTTATGIQGVFMQVGFADDLN